MWIQWANLYLEEKCFFYISLNSQTYRRLKNHKVKHSSLYLSAIVCQK